MNESATGTPPEPHLPGEPFASRLEAYLEVLGDAAALLVDPPRSWRSPTVPHPERGNSHIYYLTGVQGGGHALLLRGYSPLPVTWFCRTGGRAGARGGPGAGGSELPGGPVLPVEALGRALTALLQGTTELHYEPGTDSDVDEVVWGAMRQARQLALRNGLAAPRRIVTGFSELAKLRAAKDDGERGSLRKAARITALALNRILGEGLVGATERELEARLVTALREEGAEDLAFPPVVAAGGNAWLPHHRPGPRVLAAGELVCFDLGAEVDRYASDLARTVPVSGRFGPAQRELYQGVLAASEEGIRALVPGASPESVRRAMADALRTWVEDRGGACPPSRLRAFCPWPTFHPVGLEVHDPAPEAEFDDATTGGEAPLQEGMVVALEPALAIPPHDDLLPRDFRGLVVRIEDTCEIRSHGAVRLTEDCPRKIGSLQRMLGSRASGTGGSRGRPP